MLGGLGLDDNYARISSSGTTSFLSDGLGSTRSLLDPSGAATAAYSYTPFGETARTGSDDTPFQFTGRENDGASGLYYYRARYYSPRLSRFIQSDPIGLDGGINTYAYVEGNPLSYTDETGEFANFAVGAVTGLITGYAIAKLTGDECYGLQDALQDAALGAVGAGVVSKLNKLYRIAKLRSIANARGLQNVGQKGYTETWKNGSNALEKLDIKFEAGKSANLQAGSKVPRFSYRVDAGKFWDPFTGQMGPKGGLSHVPLEPFIPVGAGVSGAVAGGAMEATCGCGK